MHIEKWDTPREHGDGRSVATNDTQHLDALHTRISELEREVAVLRGSDARARVLGELIQRHSASQKTKGKLRSLFSLQHFFQRKQKTPLDEWKYIIQESKLFNSVWYSDRNSDVTSSGNDPLLHFLLFGAYEGRSPNSSFDPLWYLETYPDVRSSGLNPLVHYIQIGEPEGRCPGPSFDPVAYLRANPDVTAARMRPLRHYLLHGQREGRTSTPRHPKSRPVAPQISAFYSLARRLRERSVSPADEVIDIIVPIYRGRDDTLACLYSVLRAPVEARFELIAIDDCSPDRKLRSALQELEEMGLISLLVNNTNLGFVASVNRGMALHTSSRCGPIEQRYGSLR